MLQLSDHFSSHEFACRCGCGEKDVSPKLITLLELIRARVKAPVLIMSGRRCAKHNAAVGGAKNSQHVRGTAADIQVTGLSPQYLKTVINIIHAQGTHVGGLGVYKTFIHVDVRLGYARWQG